jgi:hypothetical protein
MAHLKYSYAKEQSFVHARLEAMKASYEAELAEKKAAAEKTEKQA